MKVPAEDLGTADCVEKMTALLDKVFLCDHKDKAYKAYKNWFWKKNRIYDNLRLHSWI